MCIGRSGKDSKELFKEFYEEKFSYHEFMEKTSKKIKEEIDLNGLPIKKGVRELLIYLSANQYKIGLASSTKYEGIIEHLTKAKLLEYFKVIIGGDLVEYSKPSPEIYVKACNELGVNPKEAYAIEDSHNGIRAAFGADMKVIMVPDLMEVTQEMEEKTIIICKDLLEVISFLKGGGEKCQI